MEMIKELKKVQAMKEDLFDAIVDAAGMAFERRSNGNLYVKDKKFKAIWDGLNESYVQLLNLEKELLKGLK